MLKVARNAVIGMIHVHALPGTPGNKTSIHEIVDAACQDAKIYQNCQLSGVLVENMHDLPYITGEEIGPEVVASMTSVCTAVRRVLSSNIYCGVQVLAGGNRQALAVALAAGFDFIRTEGFVFSHVADEGLMNACAGQLLRYRKLIGADHIQIFTDVKKKHCAHAITADVSIEETAKAAEFFLSDGLIVTGTATGNPASRQDITGVMSASGLPVLVGSGVTTDNVEDYLGASAFIIGSHFKHGGRWQNQVSEERVSLFMKKLNILQMKKGYH